MVEQASIFLWNPDEERPNPDAFVPPSGSWWMQYAKALQSQIAKGNLTPAAVEELTVSSRRLCGLLPNPRNWTRRSPWKGLVVGSVQSGKTQSMMGVAAVALDSGYRLIIVLAGLKDDLRTQTARRFNTNLLLQNDPIVGAPGTTTLGGPPGAQGNSRAFAPPFYRDCTDDATLPMLLPDALRELPAVLVIKKNPTTLAYMKTLLAGVYERYGVLGMPTLILDDECDEASVPGGLGEEKTVPEAIANLWEGMAGTPQVAYLGYTATAAANLLQRSDWALFPDFAVLLRSPGEDSNELQYKETVADNWYTGGDAFFEAFGDTPGEGSNFLVSASITEDDLAGAPGANLSLEESFRAYFVGGAYRLVLSPGRGFHPTLKLPEPHSMMIHTSAAQEDHSKWLEGLLRKYGRQRFGDGAFGFDGATLDALVLKEEEQWRAWHERFTRARERIADTRPHREPYRNVSWSQVKERLPEVFRNVRVKVVNSNVGDTLDYEETIAPDGAKLAPKDVFVVAIGGSRLSRGITVKGLGISYFTRWADQRYDDTLLQMSRWYGYRGPYLEFCRVFLTPASYAGFKEMNENDARLRRRLVALMREQRSPGYATWVFRASPEALPTAKLGAGKVRDLAFSPFTHVFADVKYGACAKQNEDWAHALFEAIEKRSPEVARTDSGKERGILSRGWTAVEIADILDGLAYESHNPRDEDNVHEGRFRQPEPGREPAQDLQPNSDPYHVAAYLRYWATATGGDAPAPTFNVGVSWGSRRDATSPFSFPLLDREISARERVEGAWTGRSSGWPGDYYFDRVEERLRQGKTERASGAPGLLLLCVVHKNAKGRSAPYHTPFIGISIPDGGPKFIRVVKRGGAQA